MGNDTEKANFFISDRFDADLSALNFGGGEGFDTLSYDLASNTIPFDYQIDLVSFFENNEGWIVGLEFNVDNGTVHDLRAGAAGETHTFQNIEAFRGTALADRLIDGQGSQT